MLRTTHAGSLPKPSWLADPQLQLFAPWVPPADRLREAQDVRQPHALPAGPGPKRLPDSDLALGATVGLLLSVHDRKRWQRARTNHDQRGQIGRAQR